jgi:carbamoylphosphate synthase large subunit
MKVMLIGSGPAVEGQASARAVQALKSLGHDVVLLDSNPATVATDADAAQRTYLEPLSLAAAEQVLEKEKPDALLAGVTGRAAFELALELKPTLARHGVQWLGPAEGPSASGRVPPGWSVCSLVLAKDGFGTTVELCDFEEDGQTWTKPARRLGVAEVNQLKASIAIAEGVTRARFAVHQKSGQWRVLEVSRVLDASSAFISRACGLDVVKLAVELALGGAVPEAPALGPTVVRCGETVTVAAPLEPLDRDEVLVLGGGNDWSCLHAVRALRAKGLDVVVVDPNPSALAGDDVKRVFAPLSVETCLALNARRVVVQFGGAEAVRLAPELAAHGLEVLGTHAESLAATVDRPRFAARISELDLPQPKHGRAATTKAALLLAERIGYPLLAWPEGQAAHFCRTADELGALEGPLWLEQFLDEASVADVELLRDRKGSVVIGGIVEHVEQAGVHSADAAYTLPPHSLKSEVLERMRDAASAVASGLDVVGLLNVRFAAQGKAVFLLEANAHASRALPFVCKATALPMPELAAQLMLGATLAQLGVTAEPSPRHCAVREAVFPSTDAALGLDMRSNGEVMALAESLPAAFGKSQLAAGTALPSSGAVFMAVHDDDKPAVVDLARRLVALGFDVVATQGTRAYLAKKGVSGRAVPAQPQASEMAALICTAAVGAQSSRLPLRRVARAGGVPTFTTVEAARLFVSALEARAASERVAALQSFVSLER